MRALPYTSDVQPALRLRLAGPASFPAVAWHRARGASDGSVTPVVEGMVGEIVFVQVAPHVPVAPIDQRIELPDPAWVVPFHVLRVRPGGRLLASDPGDPGRRSVERSLQRLDLPGAAAARRAPRRSVRREGVDYLDLEPVAVLDPAPGLVGLGEEHAGVDREHPRRRLDAHQQVDQHRLLFLEGAGHDEAWVVALDGCAEGGFGLCD